MPLTKCGLLFLLPLALLLASCENEEEAEPMHPISFQTSDVGLRATDTDTDNILDFRVWSVWTKDASSLLYMDAIKVSRNDNQSDWTYSPTFYWTTEGRLDFYAYSPAASTGVLDFNVGNYIKYDVTTDLDRQEDFVIASMINNPADPVKSGAVSLQFEHILAQAKIEINNQLGEAITVKRIEVTNLYRQGIYTITSGWASQSTPTTYTAEESKHMMVLPQTLDDDARIVLTYDTSTEQNLSREFPFSDGFKFEKAKKYTIYLTLD